ncbi:Agamous-like MADS-box protein AGL80 [Linum grandiflorum]
MARQRRPLRWITNNLARKAYFRKRRAALIKKVEELSILCDVPGMCVIYSPYEDPSPLRPLQPPEPPTIWPSRESAVQLLQRFMDLSRVERCKKMLNQLEYLRELIVKAEEKQKRELKKIRDMELSILMDEVRYGKGLEELDIEQRISLAGLIKDKIQEVRRRMQFLGATQGFEAPDGPLRGLTADDPIHIDDSEGSLSLLDGYEDSTDEYDDADVELNPGTGRK